MERTVERSTGSKNCSASMYALAQHESINSFSLIDLLLKERRPAVVRALFELATLTQQAVVCEPDNVELQDYACSLAWHYFRLRDCEKLDSLIGQAIAKKEEAELLASVANGLLNRFNCAIAEVEALQRFVKWQPGRMPAPLFRVSPRDALIRGELSPATIASLPSRVTDIGHFEVLDGVIEFLGRGPWVPKREPSFWEEYFADPTQRLEFQAACEELLPKIIELKGSAKEVEFLEKVKADATEARTKVEVEWNKARRNQALPLRLGSLAKDVIGRQREREA